MGCASDISIFYPVQPRPSIVGHGTTYNIHSYSQNLSILSSATPSLLALYKCTGFQTTHQCHVIVITKLTSSVIHVWRSSQAFGSLSLHQVKHDTQHEQYSCSIHLMKKRRTDSWSSYSQINWRWHWWLRYIIHHWFLTSFVSRLLAL